MHYIANLALLHHLLINCHIRNFNLQLQLDSNTQAHFQASYAYKVRIKCIFTKINSSLAQEQNEHTHFWCKLYDETFLNYNFFRCFYSNHQHFVKGMTPQGATSVFICVSGKVVTDRLQLLGFYWMFVHVWSMFTQWASSKRVEHTWPVCMCVCVRLRRGAENIWRISLIRACALQSEHSDPAFNPLIHLASHHISSARARSVTSVSRECVGKGLLREPFPSVLFENMSAAHIRRPRWK